MGQTIQILSRKQFAFRNPDRTLLDKAFEQGTAPEKSVTHKLDDALFITIPNKVQVAPAWIKTDKMWEWATSDGDIMEVTTVGSRAQNQAQAEAMQQGSDAERLAKEQAAAEALNAKTRELEVLNKAELIDHAKENYNLDLSASMKKDDMTAAILDAHKAQS